MANKDNSSGFRTHIPEPRWQQVISVIIVLVIIGLVVWSMAHGHKAK